VEASQRFVAEMSAVETLERVCCMLANGSQRDSAFEREVGAALGRYRPGVEG